MDGLNNTENTENKGGKQKGDKLKSVDVKAYLKNQKGKKIKYTDRKSVEIILATKHYAVGQIITPHVTFADDLIKNKIAKEYKAPKEDEDLDD